MALRTGWGAPSTSSSAWKLRSAAKRWLAPSTACAGSAAGTGASVLAGAGARSQAASSRQASRDRAGNRRIGRSMGGGATTIAQTSHTRPATRT
ncbi:hypothetical protein G6F62_015167 [Rhizopus arrhizus]|nr:hypothetical protein G6F62_015167 [Rhizopus arrhizus]